MSRMEYRFVFDRDLTVRTIGDPQSAPVRIDWQPAPRLHPELLPMDARDLVRVAVAVFTADKLAPRAPRDRRGRVRGLAWQRTLDLTVPLENADRWSAAASQLAEWLTFLTDDAWTFRFESRRRDPPPSRLLFDDRLPDGRVALFSQGLDSGMGAALLGRDRRPLVLASVHTHGSHQHAVEQVISGLRAVDVDARSVGLWVRPRMEACEATQRTRGFLFLLVGAATAVALGANEIYTFENGVGALNLPASEAQVGSHNTRAMHPRTFTLAENLFDLVLDRPARIVAPFLGMTKGQVCQQLPLDRLSELARSTISCDEGGARKRDPPEHCGLCTSCLLRRSALHAVRGFVDPTKYRDQATGAHGKFDLESFEHQAARFASLATWEDLLALDPAARFIDAYLLRTGPRSDEGQRHGAVLALLRAHAREARELLTNMRPQITPREPRPRTLGGQRDLFAATR